MKSLFAALFALLAVSLNAQMPEGFSEVVIEVDGMKRQTIIYAPKSSKEQPTPVVFCFHGHGGNSRHAAKSFAMHTHWPEAISVYPQGLNTPGRLTDPEGKKPGWQSGPGAMGDRDLKFFDAMLTKLKAEHQVDAKRIFSTGHSNGGGFYLPAVDDAAGGLHCHGTFGCGCESLAGQFEAQTRHAHRRHGRSVGEV